MKTEENSDEKALKNLLNGKENSFIVPNGYFEELPSKILDRIDALPDFNTSSEINPFAVPEDYFEKLPHIISDRISATRKSAFPSFLVNLKLPRFSIPIGIASIIIIAIVVLFSQKKITVQPEKEISCDDLKNSSYFESFDEDLLVGMIPAQDIEAADDSLEQYLIDNNIEISQIETAL